MAAQNEFRAKALTAFALGEASVDFFSPCTDCAEGLSRVLAKLHGETSRFLCLSHAFHFRGLRKIFRMPTTYERQNTNQRVYQAASQVAHALRNASIEPFTNDRSIKYAGRILRDRNPLRQMTLQLGVRRIGKCGGRRRQQWTYIIL